MSEKSSKTYSFHSDIDFVIKNLRTEIYSGQRLPRERLVEKDLADTYKVNRMVVRQGLSKLESEGLVFIEPYKGASVAEISLEDVYEKYQIIAMLEGYAAGLATEKLGKEEVQNLENNLAEQDAVQLENVANWHRLNIEFHKIINLHCGNRQLVNMIRRHSQFRSYWFIVLSVPGRISTNINEHHQLLQLVKDKKPNEVRMLMESHVLNAGEYMVEFLRKNVPIGLWRERS
ncbi:MAG: GntR family transcriptional regulator [Proteobacteria bacterium]|nr:GntR family transcriptional regulator [Pseudomonadota bacterium]MBU4597106.1 GntR family transcriptional regulator [Pseudomonadota bacterium]MBV1715348.1 GntR family transcriptional regulator [Desulfarculus sp.]